MKKKIIKNEWKIIPISELPDGVPVVSVKEMHDKSFAEFHLVTHVLVPLDGDWMFTKPKKLTKTITP